MVLKSMVRYRSFSLYQISHDFHGSEERPRGRFVISNNHNVCLLLYGVLVVCVGVFKFCVMFDISV